MEKHTLNELRVASKKLPPPLQDALYSIEVADKIYETGKSAGLTVDKIGILAEETGNIILGLSRPTDFIKNLSEALGIDLEKARDIAGKINHDVFLPLREALKSTHQFDISAEPSPSQVFAPGAERPKTGEGAKISEGKPQFAVKKPEMRIGREPIDENLELRTKNPEQELRTKNLELSKTPPTVGLSSKISDLSSMAIKPPVSLSATKPPPGIPPMPAVKTPAPPIMPPKPAISVGGELKDEIEKVLKIPVSPPKPATTQPPAGAMPSWIKDKNLELRTENQEQALRTKNLELSKTPAATGLSSNTLSSETLSSPPIDLRAQYKPTMPPSSPKVPPINLRKNLELRTENLAAKPDELQELRTKNLELSKETTPAMEKSQSPLIQQVGMAPRPQSPTIPKPPEPPKLPEKKMPSTGTDPYKEPIE